MKRDAADYRYRAMIGVGGIGSGSFFELEGNTTLGREESRGGRFLDRRDYCKLHIISHYVKALLGPDFAVIPVGKIGDDDTGAQVLKEMQEARLDTRQVTRSPGDPTLYSFCFLYPDGCGGNLTTTDSACSKVDRQYVEAAEPVFKRFKSRGVALAAPEVPLEARQALLKLASKYGFLRVASLTSAEVPVAIESGMIGQLDLLALNLDEATAAAGLPCTDSDPVRIVEPAIDRLCRANRKIHVSITAGMRGSWSWDGSSLVHAPICETKTVCTAGAGDAHVSGMIAGLVGGLSLADAQQLGTLVAAMSVTSPHTINKDITTESLLKFAQEHAPSLYSVCRL